MTHTAPEIHFEEFRTTGDPASLSAAFQRCTDGLYRSALHFAPDEEDAADLVQATLLAAVEGRERFDSNGNLLLWMRGILKNLARQQLAKKQPESLDDRMIEDRKPGPPESCHWREVRMVIDQAIRETSHLYRPILELHLLEGLAPQDIAERLRMSGSTVRSRLQRGLAIVRQTVPFTALGLVAFIATTRAARSAALDGSTTPTPPSSAPPSSIPGATSNLSRATPALLATAALLGTSFLGLLAFGESDPGEPSLDSTRPLSRNETNPPTHVANTSLVRRASDDLATIEEAKAHAVRVCWGETGLPAEDIPVRLRPRTHVGIGLNEGLGEEVFSTRTDARGLASFDEVPPGELEFWILDAGPAWSGTPKLGDSPLRVRIWPITWVRGRVQNAQGEAIANARVFVGSQRARHTTGYLAATADSLGAFRVPVLDLDWSLWARAEGYACSMAYRPEVTTREPDLVLSLGALPSPSRGRIRREDGGRVDGAVVALFDLSHRYPGIYTTSREDGRFEVEDTPAGDYLLVAHTQGAAPAWKHVRVEHGAPSDWELTLPRGGRIRGQLKADYPLDIAKILLNAYPAELHDIIAMTSSPSRVHEDGSFQLEHVPPGLVSVRVERGLDRERPLTTARVRVVNGSESLVDLTLESSDRSIGGIVVDRRGRPIQGMRIVCWPVETPFEDLQALAREGITSGDGRFTIPGTLPGEHVLVVTGPNRNGARGVFPWIRRPRVHPGESDLRIVISPSSRPRGSEIVCRLVDSKGHPVAARLTVRQRGFPWTWGTTLGERGCFNMGTFPPGDYTLEMECQASGHRLSLPPISLASGEKVDLGEVRVDAPGHLVCEPPSRWQQAADAEVIDPYGNRTPLSWIGGELRVALAPGNYTLVYRDGRCGLREKPISIQSGKTHRESLELPPAYSCRLRFEIPQGALLDRWPGGLELTILDERANLIRFHLPDPSKGHFLREVWLAPGAYSLEARLGPDLYVAREFVVEEIREGALDFRFLLR